MRDRFRKLVSLEKRLGYAFRNKDLLLQSMLHSSFVNENRDLDLQSNERLEFLGDAVLELVISTELMRRFKHENEGTLSMKRAALVREATLARLARRLRLMQYLIVGHGENRDGGHQRDSVLSDAFEALLGALYLDGGFRAVKSVILDLYKNLVPDLGKIEKSYNFKNQLQEYTQNKFRALPRYKLAGQTGPEHQRRFKVSIYLNNKYLTWGSGTSIKKAEQTASKNALALLAKRGEL